MLCCQSNLDYIQIIQLFVVTTRFVHILVVGYNSEFLPTFKTLASVYKGDNSGVDLHKKLLGNRKLKEAKTLAATDSLRMSDMLNQLDGHHIPKTQSQGAFIGTDNKVYIYDLTALKTYLTTTYKDQPQTASSAAAFKGQRGIMMLDVSQSDGSAGSVGLWDGSKMHQITDHTKSNSVRSVTFWKTKGKMYNLLFTPNVVWVFCGSKQTSDWVSERYILCVSDLVSE